MNKTRKYLALFVASICLSLQAWAETFSVANTEGVFITYETTSETTVCVIKGESNYAGNVVIPTSVSYNDVEYVVDAIGEYAFFECPNLESVEIPNSVQTIGGRAFENCSALASVTIGESVTRIGYDAFKRSGLTSVVLPNSLEYIDYHAFDGCANLEYVSLGLSIQTIRENVFQGCDNLATVNVGSISSLMNIEFTNNDSNPLTKAEHLYLNGEEVTELVIPDGVTEIPANFFSGLTGITSVVIPGSVFFIGDNAFSGCTSLASVTFPNSPFTLGQNVFANTAFLNNAEDGVIYVGNIVYGYQGTMPENASIVIKEGTTAIVENAFLNCTSLTSIEVPATVTYVGKNAFAGTTWYETQPDGPIYINKVFYKYKGTMALNSEYEVADGTVSISDEAFKGYTQLSKLVLPSSLTTIGEQAFHGCLGLADLSIGEGLTYTGNDAFGGCSNLNNIYASNVAQLFFLSSGSGQSNPFALAKHLFVNDEEVTELVIPNGVEELNEGFFYNFDKNVTSVTIPNSVTKIGGSAFKDWTNLAQVTFGESLKTIGDWAFISCSSLTRIDLPNSLESIGGYAFRDCSNLSDITLGDSLKTIGEGAFRGCTALESIIIPNSVRSFARDVFRDCSSLSSVTLSSSLKTIGDWAFAGCSALTRIDLPNSLESIDSFAFDDCSNLSYITFGESLKTIGEHAFNGCGSLNTVNIPNTDFLFSDYSFGYERNRNPFSKASILHVNGKEVTELVIPEGVEELNGGFFYNFGKNVTSVTIANSVKNIGDRAFSDWTNLSQVTFGESLETIGEFAFYVCFALSRIDLPNSLNSIGHCAFAECSNLSYLTIGDSLKTIASGAFSRCDTVNISKVDFLFNDYSFGNTNPFSIASTLHVNGKEVTELAIPDGVEEIRGGFFYNFGKNVTSVTIPNSVKNIGNSAFRDWTNLSRVTFGESLKTIGIEAFWECMALESVVFPNSLDSIMARAFEGCSKLSSVTFGDSIVFVGESAFYRCENLQSIHVTNLETWYAVNFENGSNPLYYAKHLYCNGEEVTQLVIPDGVTEVTKDLFKGYENITSVVIPNSVVKIGDYAFSNLANLKSVTLGDSLKTIGTAAFRGCTALESIVIPNSVTSFARDVFRGCSNLASVTLGNSLQTIGGSSFWECTRLDSIIIPNSVTTIEDRVFEGCTKLSYITLGDSLKTIGEYAFHRCDGFNTVNVSKLDVFFNDFHFGNDNANPFNKAKNLCVNDEPIPDVLVVPNTVEKIPGGVFNGRGIISLTIPNSVKVIGEKAFENCEKLTLVSFGNSVDSIGHRAFANCNALESIELPNSLKTISSEAFLDCRSVSSLTFGNSLETIGERAFYGCQALESLSLPNTISRIGASAFENCNKVLTVTLSSRLKTIENSTFKYCRSLESITIPNSVKEISSEAFYDCYKLATVVLGDSIESIKQNAFGYIGHLNSESTKVYIPSLDWLFRVNIEEFQNEHLFRDIYIGQQPLTTITIPDNFTEAPILKMLYNSCISSLNTGDGLKILPEGESRNITQVTLGSNVTKVEAEFPEAYIVLSNNATPPVITEKTFPKCMFDNGAEGVVVLLNANDQKAYSKAKVWEGMQMSNQSNQVAVQVSSPGSIGTDLALGLRMPVAKVVGLTVSGEINEQDIMQMNKNMMSLLYLDLSDAIVDKIPDDAFNGKQQLLSLVLPKTTKVVGNSAFKGCNGIEELQMPMDVTEIGDEAFTGTSIRSMDFNYALKKIGNRAFANTPLKEISFQNKVESIGNEAFYGCNLEQELLFSETLRSIGDRAFDGQRGISGHLTIPESVASVGEGAFRGTSISTVFISGKMTTLESSVFANCNLLDVVYIPDNITNINSSAFQNCSSLKNLRLSQNIEEIGSEAFRSIPIRSVNVPENAKTLKSYSFADCSNLRFVTLPSTMTSLEEGVFSGCRQLMNLTTKALTPPVVMSNTFRGVNTDKCIISMPTVSIEAYITAPYWGRFMEMRNDIAVETEGKGSISFVSGDTEEDDDAASARTTRAGNATETMEDNITLVDDGSSLYVPQNGVVRFHITPAEGETILSATFDGVDITSQIIDGVFVTTADKLSSKLEVNFSQVTKTSQLITWEQSFEPLMVGDKVALSATASSGLPVTFDFADENSKECASLSNNTLTITKSGVIAIIALQKGDDEYASVATEMKYIRAYEYGDANADMEINSADLATAVDYAIGNNPQEFLFKAADVNKDKKVNVADVAGVVDIVLSAPATTDDVNGNARDVAISNNVLSVLDGNRLNFYVTQEKESFLTFQCDVRITDDSMLELDIAGNPIVSISNNMGTKNHIAVARLLTDGYIRVLVYSTDNTPIPNNYSFALHIGHELNESDIEISNAGYSYRDNGQITYASLNSGVVTGLDNVTGNIDQTDIKVNGNTISFNSPTDCLMPVVSVNGMTYMLNVKAGYNEFTINKGVYVIGKNKVIIK